MQATAKLQSIDTLSVVPQLVNGKSGTIVVVDQYKGKFTGITYGVDLEEPSKTAEF